MTKHMPGAIGVIIPALAGVVAATLPGGCATHHMPDGAPTTSVRPAALSAETAVKSGEAVVPEGAAPSGTITLKDAVAHALMNSPTLKAFSLQTRIADARKLQASLRPNPELAVEEGYRQGKFDYLSLLDAQRTYFDAQQQYLDALTAYHKARTDIELLLGRSIDTAEQGR